jgi:hypothetical protein
VRLLVKDWRAMLKFKRRVAMEQLLLAALKWRPLCRTEYSIYVGKEAGCKEDALPVTIEGDSLGRKKLDSPAVIYSKLYKIVARVEGAALMLRRLPALLSGGGGVPRDGETASTSLTGNSLKAALLAIKHLHRNLQHISEALTPQLAPRICKRGRYRDRQDLSKRRGRSLRQYLSVSARLSKQLEFVDRAVMAVARVSTGGQIKSCSMKAADKLGDFPRVKQLLSQRCNPRFRSIVETLGRKWLSKGNQMLRRRVYVVGEPTDPDCLLLESSSIATESGSSSSYLDGQTLGPRESPSKVLM